MLADLLGCVDYYLLSFDDSNITNSFRTMCRPFDGLSAGKIREMEWTVVHH
jgi:hypothetical protein